MKVYFFIYPMSSLDTDNHLGASFLHKKNSSLHTAPEVGHVAARVKKNIGTILKTPVQKIDAWMEVLKKTHEGHRTDQNVMERIKRAYHRNHVITPENVPESEFLREQRIARNLGYGTVEITKQFKEKKIHEIISDQEQSLDRWINYLTSRDALYPMWAKYWAFSSVLKMGKLVKEEIKNEQGGAGIRFKFATRDTTTAAAFPTLNRRALGLCIGAIQEKIQGSQQREQGASTINNTSTKLSDEAFLKLLAKERFDMLYAQYLTELPQYTTEGLSEIRGSWVKYPQYSDPQPLTNSLEGYPLEWCTANKETARTQLKGGDFYVYYSLNKEGNAEIPRLAIRMENGSIAEVRGIAPNQNLDPFIAPVVEEKMKEFPDGKKYQKKSADMQRLTELEMRFKKSAELSREDLRFLYEIDGKIEGFGYDEIDEKTGESWYEDPRIKEILKGRDVKKDLVSVFQCTPEQISTTRLEALEGNIIYHIDSLNLTSGTSAREITLPQFIGKHLYLNRVTSVKGITFPQSIGGNLYLKGLKSAEGLTLPQSIGGNLYLNGLTSTEGLTLPEYIGGDLYINGLTSTEGLTLPKYIGRDLYLSNNLPQEERENLIKKHPHINFVFN